MAFYNQLYKDEIIQKYNVNYFSKLKMPKIKKFETDSEKNTETNTMEQENNEESYFYNIIIKQIINSTIKNINYECKSNIFKVPKNKIKNDLVKTEYESVS